MLCCRTLFKFCFPSVLCFSSFWSASVHPWFFHRVEHFLSFPLPWSAVAGLGPIAQSLSYRKFVFFFLLPFQITPFPPLPSFLCFPPFAPWPTLSWTSFSFQAGESSTSGLFKKTITKLSTEYRLQFVWPHVRRAIRAAGAHGAAGDGDGADTVDAPPRKSLSMGALKAAQIGAAGGGTIASVHKKRTTNEREGAIAWARALFNQFRSLPPSFFRLFFALSLVLS